MSISEVIEAILVVGIGLMFAHKSKGDLWEVAAILMLVVVIVVVSFLVWGIFGMTGIVEDDFKEIYRNLFKDRLLILVYGLLLASLLIVGKFLCRKIFRKDV